MKKLPASESLPASKMVCFSVATIGNGMFNAFFNSAIPLFLARYPLPFMLVGLLAQERSFLGAFLEPIVGAVSDRTRTPLGRRRPFFLIGAPLAAVFLIFLSTQPHILALVAVLLFLPFFLAISDRPYRAMMADITTPQQRGRLGGVMAVTEMAGQVGLLFLISRIWETQESLVFYIIAVMIVVGFGFTFLTVKEPMPIPPVPPVKMASPLSYLQKLTTFREAGKWVCAQFLFWFAIGGVSPFVTRYAVSELDLEESQAFLLLLLLVAFTAIMAIPAGLLGDRLGKKPVLAVGMAVFAVAVFYGSQVTSLQGIAVALAIAGLANGVNQALGFAFLTELLPKQRMGELTAISSMTWSFAQPLGSTFAGYLADQAGTLRVTFVMASIMLICCLLVLLTVKPGMAATQLVPAGGAGGASPDEAGADPAGSPE